MGNNPFNLGDDKCSEDDGFRKTLFYFMREFKINPYDEDFEGVIVWKKLWWKFKYPAGIKIVKKGCPQPRFTALIHEIKKHYDEEANQMKKNSRRR